MEMGALIDSSVLIAAERGALDLAGILDKHRETEFALSLMTVSELLHGVHRAQLGSSWKEGSVHRGAPELVAGDLLRPNRRQKSRPPLGQARRQRNRHWTHDLVIAATAVSCGMDVATRDARSFPPIPGLSILSW